GQYLPVTATQHLALCIRTQLMLEHTERGSLPIGIMCDANQLRRFPSPHRTRDYVEAHWSPPPASASSCRTICSASSSPMERPCSLKSAVIRQLSWASSAAM